jgi:hypothetical protein
MKKVFGGTLPAAIWSKFMTAAHEGVPVAELPGTELVSYLLAQPAPGTEATGWTVAQAEGQTATPSQADSDGLQILGRGRGGAGTGPAGRGAQGLFSGGCSTADGRAGLGRSADCVQAGAILLQPGAGDAVARIEPFDHRPEIRAMIHLGEMRNLVGGEVIEDVRRREYQPP